MKLANEGPYDLGVVSKTSTTGGRSAPHRQVGVFFRGVISIGALCKELRLPPLRKYGRLRQKGWMARLGVRLGWQGGRGVSVGPNTLRPLHADTEKRHIWADGGHR